MVADVFVDGGLHLQLSSADLAMSRGVFLMNELDGEDRVIGAGGTGFLDAVSYAMVSGISLRLLRSQEREYQTYQA